MFICKYCGKECKNSNSLRNHERLCKLNPNKAESGLAKYLDANNIEWKRPKERFEYIFENKLRHYTPDFYIVSEDTFVEIKNSTLSVPSGPNGLSSTLISNLALGSSKTASLS